MSEGDDCDPREVKIAFGNYFLKIVGCRALHRRDRDDQGPRYLLSLVCLEGVTQKGRTKFLCNISVGNLVLHSKIKVSRVEGLFPDHPRRVSRASTTRCEFLVVASHHFLGGGVWRLCAVPFFQKKLETYILVQGADFS